MKDRLIHVFIDLAGKIHYVGQLWAHLQRTRSSASFQYDSTWLTNPEKFALEPALLLGEETFQTESDQTLFGAMGDSAPDQWGRILMRRVEAQRAHIARQHPKTLIEIDYLLGVNDEVRQRHFLNKISSISGVIWFSIF